MCCWSPLINNMSRSKWITRGDRHQAVIHSLYGHVTRRLSKFLGPSSWCRLPSSGVTEFILLLPCDKRFHTGITRKKHALMTLIIRIIPALHCNNWSSFIINVIIFTCAFLRWQVKISSFGNKNNKSEMQGLSGSRFRSVRFITTAKQQVKYKIDSFDREKEKTWLH